MNSNGITGLYKWSIDAIFSDNNTKSNNKKRYDGMNDFYKEYDILPSETEYTSNINKYNDYSLYNDIGVDNFAYYSDTDTFANRRLLKSRRRGRGKDNNNIDPIARRLFENKVANHIDKDNKDLFPGRFPTPSYKKSDNKEEDLHDIIRKVKDNNDNIKRIKEEYENSIKDIKEENNKLIEENNIISKKYKLLKDITRDNIEMHKEMSLIIDEKNAEIAELKKQLRYK